MSPRLDCNNNTKSNAIVPLTLDCTAVVQKCRTSDSLLSLAPGTFSTTPTLDVYSATLEVVEYPSDEMA